MSRQFNLYTKNKTALKNNLIALLDQTYPGVNTFFESPVRDDGRQKWVDFAGAFWHVDCVRGLSETAFIERCRKWCKRHGYNISDSKASTIYDESKEFVTMLPKCQSTKLLIQETITQLNAVSKAVEVFRAEMLRLA